MLCGVCLSSPSREGEDEAEEDVGEEDEEQCGGEVGGTVSPGWGQRTESFARVSEPRWSWRYCACCSSRSLSETPRGPYIATGTARHRRAMFVPIATAQIGTVVAVRKAARACAVAVSD